MKTEVLIFKTDLATPEQVKQVSTVFEPLDTVMHWTVDLEDVDRVLRLVCINLKAESVQGLLEAAGISCEHMAYEL
jgi:hypothetical protein